MPARRRPAARLFQAQTILLQRVWLVRGFGVERLVI
jgi:hypothetical protein